MNRADKPRQQKLAKKAASNAKLGKATIRSPGQQTLAIQESLDLALQHYTAGRLPEAEGIYQQILQADPNQPVALHLLGIIGHQGGNHDSAVDLITKALAVKPDYAEAHNSLGVALKKLGRLDKAAASYRKALAVKPDYVEAHNNLGNALKDQRNLNEAVASYRKALTIQPNFAEAHNNLGSTLKELGRLDEAVASYHKALAIKPDYPVAHSNLGNALHSLGRLDEAVASYHKALAIKPDLAEAHSNLGNVLQDLGRLDEAMASYRKALTIQPDYAEAHSNLGNVLLDLGRLDEAVASYRKALTIQPDFAEAHSNLGNALQGLGRLEDAVASHHKALAIKPDYAEGHLNLGFALLAAGRLQEGLDEHEWRWRNVHSLTRPRCFSQPIWDGIVDLKDRTILVWGEQGPQDMSIWSSCLPHVSARTRHCILECPPKLVPLFARSFPDVEVRPENWGSDAERDDFDFHLPMGSLFRQFLPDLTEASEVKAFLVPDPDRVAFWKKRLEEMGSGPFVGISWKSPLMTPRRSPNYTELADWAPTFANREAVFVNLQCKDYEDDLAVAKRDFGVTVHDFGDLDLYDDLDEVAALAGALDVAISVSTAVAAITAGVGTPTWVITWRQSYWNNFLLAPRGPSVRFFERDTWESWDAVFVSIAECLAATDF